MWADDDDQEIKGFGLAPVKSEGAKLPFDGLAGPQPGPNRWQQLVARVRAAWYELTKNEHSGS